MKAFKDIPATSCNSLTMADSPASRARKVLMGTCGWSDQTLLKCGKFYPASVRSAEDRLRHYSTHFPCVEVDTSTYGIPSIASINGWLCCIPKGFLFHFKAFGFFCSKSCSLTAIPIQVRAKVSAACPGKDYIHLNAISESLRDELWQIFNSVLRVAHAAGNLGVVVFQFHLSFKPTKENQAHVEWCRKNLDPCFSMAAEFRCRDWFNDQHLESTTNRLKNCGIALVAADELQHETFQKDREQTGLPKGQERVTLPVAWALTHPEFMYIRVHRREGRQRLLSEAELLCWATRLMADLPRELKGPIYFMWGTDWEDQPIINAKFLNDKLADMAFDWKAAHQLVASKSMLERFFGQKTGNRKESERTPILTDFMPVGNTHESMELSADKSEWCSESSKKDGVLNGGFVKLQTLASTAMPSSHKKHSQDVSALLGIKKSTNNPGKQNASMKKTITAYFQKSSSC